MHIPVGQENGRQHTHSATTGRGNLQVLVARPERQESRMGNSLRPMWYPWPDIDLEVVEMWLESPFMGIKEISKETHSPSKQSRINFMISQICTTIKSRLF